MVALARINNFRKRKVVQSVGIYTFSNFFTKGLSFLLIPLFTNPAYLTPEDNGLLSLFSTSIIFLMPFISLGLIQSTSTDFFKLEKKEFKDFFTTGFVLPVLITILSVIVLYFVKDTLFVKYHFPSAFMWIIPLITFLTFCNEQLLSIVRNSHEALRFLGVSIGRIVIELSLTVLLIVFFQYAWQGRIMGIMVGYIALGMYAFFYFYKKGYLFGRIRKDYLKSEIAYALPIFIMQTSVFVMGSSDKFFLANDHGVVGVYAVACVFASVITVLCTALLQYIFPKVYSLLAMPEVDYPAIRKHFVLYAGVMIAGTLMLIVAIPFLYRWFVNDKYHGAIQYVYLLVIGYFFWTITYFFYAFLLYHKKKRKILMLSLLSILVSVTCNYFFIKAFDDMGAAIAVCTSYFIVLLITLALTKNYIRKLFSSTGNNQPTKRH